MNKSEITNESSGEAIVKTEPREKESLSGLAKSRRVGGANA